MRKISPGQVEDAVLEAVVPHVHFYVLAPGMVLFAQGEQVRLPLSMVSRLGWSSLRKASRSNSHLAWYPA